MIEGISAVTLGTHEMPRAVRFYRAPGFEILHGDSCFDCGLLLPAPKRFELLTPQIRSLVLSKLRKQN